MLALPRRSTASTNGSPPLGLRSLTPGSRRKAWKVQPHQVLVLGAKRYHGLG